MSEIIFLNENAINLSVEDESADLILTSPPYFGVDPYRYGGDHTQQINTTHDEKEYVNRLIEVSKEFYRVLKNNGSLIININAPICYRYYVELVDQLEFKYAGSFFWDHSEDSPYSERFAYCHQIWLHFYKGETIYENPFGIKKHKGSVIKTRFNNMNLEKEKELSQHGFLLDAYSIEVAEHFIKTYSRPQGTVLDPFGGSGVAAIAAYQNNRTGITNDISEDAVKLAKKRFEIYVENS